MKKSKKTKATFFVLTAIVICTIAFYMFAPLNKTGKTAYLYIDNDDNMDSVSMKLSAISREYGITAVRTLARHTGYENEIRSGRYEVGTGIGAFMLLHRLSNGQQTAMRLTIPSVRTADRLAEELSGKLMMSKTDLLNYLENNDSCAKYGKDTATAVCLFIPDTYEVYWNISPAKLLSKMKSASETFWKGSRTEKAARLGLTPDEVMTIASIIDEETAYEPEKPMIAGMYYNRFKQGMPLQADPTIKFALRDFEIKRIYNNMLSVDSPYNTYKNIGLPPGPIRIPSVAGIDAVLNLVHHDYMYMCAKEDFSGSHNFARTYQEHLQNAERYSKALNERGVK